MLEAHEIHVRFGGLRALDGADLTVARGSITGLIGPNGAGKTTLFNVIAGARRPDRGRVLLDGADVTGRPPHELFRARLLRSFQIAREFGSLTVRENLMTVPGGQAGESLWRVLFARGRVRHEDRALAAKADEVLAFLELDRLAEAPAAHLSGGQKKLLELGRIMMTEPKVVLLDEISAGVNRTLLKTIGAAIRRLQRERGYSFCLIEHDMDFVARLCDPVVVMAEGKVLTAGGMAEVSADPRVIDAYLGGAAFPESDGVAA